MTLRTFVDANIIFTAAYNPDGLASLLFELGRLGLLTVLTSEHAVEEARINLQIKKPAALARFEKLLRQVQLVHAPVTCPVALKLPGDDRLIAGAAFAGRATHLITGDKNHFGRYFNKPEETGGLVIQTVRQFFSDRF